MVDKVKEMIGPKKRSLKNLGWLVPAFIIHGVLYFYKNFLKSIKIAKIL